MNETRETECAKCGSGTRTEEWTATEGLAGARLLTARCDNPYCEDYSTSASGA